MSSPTVQTRTDLPYVSIPAEANLKEWGPVTQLVPELLGWVERKGLELTAPPFFRYWVIGDEEARFRLEVGAPVNRQIDGDGRVVAGRIPAGAYATVVHAGHPDRIEETLDRLESWIDEQGLVAAQREESGDVVWEGRFEFYPTDPKLEPDPERWRVEVAYLLEGDAP